MMHRYNRFKEIKHNIMRLYGNISKIKDFYKKTVSNQAKQDL